MTRPAEAPAVEIDHVQITVARNDEAATLAFYRSVLSLQEIEKPDSLKKNGGAWFKVGSIELHVSPEDLLLGNLDSKRHVCFKTPDLSEFRRRLTAHGIEVMEDKQPVSGWIRFYVRDPGGNRIEIAQRL